MGTPAVGPNRDAATAASRRAVKFLVPGLLLAVLAVMMLEQSGRWLLTEMSRASFVRDEFEITNLRDQPGRGGFGYGGRVVSTGETVASKSSIIVSLGRPLASWTPPGRFQARACPSTTSRRASPGRHSTTRSPSACNRRTTSRSMRPAGRSSTRLSRWARSG